MAPNVTGFHPPTSSLSSSPSSLVSGNEQPSSVEGAAQPVEGPRSAPEAHTESAEKASESPRVAIRTDLSRVANATLLGAKATALRAVEDARRACKLAAAAREEASKAAHAARLWRDPSLCPAGPLLEGEARMPLSQLEESAELLLRLIRTVVFTDAGGCQGEAAALALLAKASAVVRHAERTRRRADEAAEEAASAQTRAALFTREVEAREKMKETVACEEETDGKPERVPAFTCRPGGTVAPRGLGRRWHSEWHKPIGDEDAKQFLPLQREDAGLSVTESREACSRRARGKSTLLLGPVAAARLRAATLQLVPASRESSAFAAGGSSDSQDPEQTGGRRRHGAILVRSSEVTGIDENEKRRPDDNTGEGENATPVFLTVVDRQTSRRARETEGGRERRETAFPGDAAQREGARRTRRKGRTQSCWLDEGRGRRGKTGFGDKRGQSAEQRLSRASGQGASLQLALPRAPSVEEVPHISPERSSSAASPLARNSSQVLVSSTWPRGRFVSAVISPQDRFSSGCASSCQGRNTLFHASPDEKGRERSACGTEASLRSLCVARCSSSSHPPPPRKGTLEPRLSSLTNESTITACAEQGYSPFFPPSYPFSSPSSAAGFLPSSSSLSRPKRFLRPHRAMSAPGGRWRPAEDEARQSRLVSMRPTGGNTLDRKKTERQRNLCSRSYSTASERYGFHRGSRGEFGHGEKERDGEGQKEDREERSARSRASFGVEDREYQSSQDSYKRPLKNEKANIARRVQRVAAFLDLLRCLLPALIHEHSEEERQEETGTSTPADKLSQPPQQERSGSLSSPKKVKELEPGLPAVPSSLASSNAVSSSPTAESQGQAVELEKAVREETKLEECDACPTFALGSPDPRAVVKLLTSRPFVATFGELLHTTLAPILLQEGNKAPVSVPSGDEEGNTREEATRGASDHSPSSLACPRDAGSASGDGKVEDEAGDERQQGGGMAERSGDECRRERKRNAAGKVRFATEDDASFSGESDSSASWEVGTAERSQLLRVPLESLAVPNKGQGERDTETWLPRKEEKTEQKEEKESNLIQLRSGNIREKTEPRNFVFLDRHAAAEKAAKDAATLSEQQKRLATVLDSRRTADVTKDLLSTFFVDPETRCLLPLAVSALLRLLANGFVLDIEITKPIPALVRWPSIFRSSWVQLLHPFASLSLRPLSHKADKRPRRVSLGRNGRQTATHTKLGSATEPERTKTRQTTSETESETESEIKREMKREMKRKTGRETVNEGAGDRSDGSRNWEKASKSREPPAGVGEGEAREVEARRVRKRQQKDERDSLSNVADVGNRGGSLCELKRKRNVSAPPPQVLKAIRRELERHPERWKASPQKWVSTRQGDFETEAEGEDHSIRTEESEGHALKRTEEEGNVPLPLPRSRPSSSFSCSSPSSSKTKIATRLASVTVSHSPASSTSAFFSGRGGDKSQPARVKMPGEEKGIAARSTKGLSKPTRRISFAVDPAQIAGPLVSSSSSVSPHPTSLSAAFSPLSPSASVVSPFSAFLSLSPQASSSGEDVPSQVSMVAPAAASSALSSSASSWTVFKTELRDTIKRKACLDTRSSCSSPSSSLCSLRFCSSGDFAPVRRDTRAGPASGKSSGPTSESSDKVSNEFVWPRERQTATLVEVSPTSGNQTEANVGQAGGTDSRGARRKETEERTNPASKCGTVFGEEDNIRAVWRPGGLVFRLRGVEAREEERGDKANGEGESHGDRKTRSLPANPEAFVIVEAGGTNLWTKKPEKKEEPEKAAREREKRCRVESSQLSRVGGQCTRRLKELRERGGEVAISRVLPGAGTLVEKDSAEEQERRKVQRREREREAFTRKYNTGRGAADYEGSDTRDGGQGEKGEETGKERREKEAATDGECDAEIQRTGQTKTSEGSARNKCGEKEETETHLTERSTVDNSKAKISGRSHKPKMDQLPDRITEKGQAGQAAATATRSIQAASRLVAILRADPSRPHPVEACLVSPASSLSFQSSSLSTRISPSCEPQIPSCSSADSGSPYSSSRFSSSLGACLSLRRSEPRSGVGVLPSSSSLTSQFPSSFRSPSTAFRCASDLSPDPHSPPVSLMLVRSSASDASSPPPRTMSASSILFSRIPKSTFVNRPSSPLQSSTLVSRSPNSTSISLLAAASSSSSSRVADVSNHPACLSNSFTRFSASRQVSSSLSVVSASSRLCSGQASHGQLLSAPGSPPVLASSASLSSPPACTAPRASSAGHFSFELKRQLEEEEQLARPRRPQPVSAGSREHSTETHVWGGTRVVPVTSNGSLRLKRNF
ncbi:hypothetical protein TGPRC2_293840 [Toxoplasma gondii TgCatPRC2]|uniref:Uncharacterized protein n=1 Tax=Toxoplasma gondii TgCatPRC2 TaxID=1130821 RepID=A0A151H998_TOXGO|nr:hypothetical protein TGPRC2_293840 [Toxoplasma gondii TgCatPRC2]